jgi:hypothetical protein
MTSFLHWRKTTWVLVLWSAYIATWATVTGSALTLAAVWWLAGMIVPSLLRLTTQPPFPPRRALPVHAPNPAATERRRDAD